MLSSWLGQSWSSAGGARRRLRPAWPGAPRRPGARRRRRAPSPPVALVPTLSDVPVARLKERGVRGVILDKDNTVRLRTSILSTPCRRTGCAR